MSVWDALEAELDRWAPARATLWWRDDDAAAPSPALERLLGRADVPLGLAAIPAASGQALAAYLAVRQQVAVLQHGFAHVNHEAPGQDKMELGTARPASLVLAELARGWQRLARLFGNQALPVLVPP